MVLSDREIEEALNKGLIVIDPLPALDFYSASAVDLRLSRDLLIFKTEEELQREEPGGVERSIVLDLESLDLREWLLKYAKAAPLDNNGTYPFPPRTFLLGMTEESVELPKGSKIAARVEGKSKFARTGLTIHMTAPTIHADFRGKIALEMYNFGNYPVRLRPGMRICQLIFERVGKIPKRVSTSQFLKQKTLR
jgi:dCTP deaminase